MTLQQMTVFLSVCEELNYTRAAERVFMSRQAVRQNILELEKEFNGALFENRNNRIFLTEKGALLKPLALQVNEKYQQLQRAMTADIRLSRPLRIGISVSAIPDYLPELLGQLDRFVQLYPNLPIETLRIENDEAAPALLSDALDAAIVIDLSRKHAGLVRTVLTSHPAAVLVNSRHPLYQRQRVSLPDLSGETMYLPGLGAEFSFLLHAAEQEGADIDFVMMPSYYQVLFLVQDRGGVALNRYYPGEDVDPSRVRSIPLQGAPPLCSSFLICEGRESAALHLLRDWLLRKLHFEYRLPA